MLRDWGNGSMPKASDAASLAAAGVDAGDIDDDGIAEDLARKLGASEDAIKKAPRPKKTGRDALEEAKKKKAQIKRRLAMEEAEKQRKLGQQSTDVKTTGLSIFPIAVAAGLGLLLLSRRR